MKLLVIGAGNMGLTYAESMSKSTLLGSKRLQIYDTDPNKIARLKKEKHFEVFTDLKDCLPKADIVFIAVKPYHSDALFENMMTLIHQEQIVVSLMAGVSIQTIQDSLGIKKVVRTMPNLPAKVGKGVTSYTASKEVSRVELTSIRYFLDVCLQTKVDFC